MSSRHAEKERVSLCGLFEMCTQKIFCRTIGAQTLNELRSQNMLAIPPSSASLLQLRAISYHVEGTPENNNFLRRYHLKNTRRFSATPPPPQNEVSVRSLPTFDSRTSRLSLVQCVDDKDIHLTVPFGVFDPKNLNMRVAPVHVQLGETIHGLPHISRVSLLAMVNPPFAY